MDPETLERRCPRLGGDVAFAYCKAGGDKNAPCFKIFDCWWERFDVVDHMRSCLSADAFEALQKERKPPNKVVSLLDLIQQARERATES